MIEVEQVPDPMGHEIHEVLFEGGGLGRATLHGLQGDDDVAEEALWAILAGSSGMLPAPELLAAVAGGEGSASAGSARAAAAAGPWA